MDESRTLRNRHTSIQDDLDRLPNAPVGGSRSLVVKTTTVGTYPTSANAFFGVINQSVDGAETEGASASFTADSTDVFYAYNEGTAIPDTGTYLIVHSVGGKWVFSFCG